MESTDARQATMVVVRVALARGYLSQVQLRQALLLREQLRAAGRQAELLPILRARFLDPRVIAELTEVYRRAVADHGSSGSQRVAAARSTSSRRVAQQRDTRESPTVIIDPRELPAPAKIAEDEFRRSGELLERPAEDDPDVVRDFLRRSTGSEMPTVIDPRLRASAKRTSARKATSPHPVGWGSSDSNTDLVSPAGRTGSPADSAPVGYPPAFGSGAAPPGSAFGAPPPSAFGSTPARAFGSTPAQAFGSTPAQAFGSTPRGPSGFGAGLASSHRSPARGGDTWKDPETDPGRPKSWTSDKGPDAAGERRAAPPPAPRPAYEYESKPLPPPSSGLGTPIAVGAAAFALVLFAGVGAFVLSGGVAKDDLAAAPTSAGASPAADPKTPEPSAPTPTPPKPTPTPPKPTPPKPATAPPSSTPTPPAAPSTLPRTTPSAPPVTPRPTSLGTPRTPPSSLGTPRTPPPSPYGTPRTPSPSPYRNPRPAYGTPPGGQPGSNPAPSGRPAQPQRQQPMRLSVVIDGGVDSDALPEAARAAFARFEELRGQGNGADALSALDEAVSAAPEVPSLLVQRGAIRFVSRREQEAAGDLEAALALDPKCGRAYVYQALVAYARRDTAGALEAATRGVELAADFPFAFVMLAMAKFLSNDGAGARATLDDAIGRHPGAFVAYDLRVQLRLAAGDAVGAQGDFTKMIELSPGNPGALFGRAQVRAVQRDFAGALADLDTILSLDLVTKNPASRPFVGNVHFTRAMYLLQQQRPPQEARADMQAFVQLAPQHPMAEKAREFLRQVDSGQLTPGGYQPPGK